MPYSRFALDSRGLPAARPSRCAIGRCAGVLLLAALLAACAGPVGVRPWSLQEAYRQTYANSLSSDAPSVFSVQVLLRLNLFEKFADEPDAALAQLHAGLAPSGDEDRLFALAELSFQHAEALGGAGSAAGPGPSAAAASPGARPDPVRGARAYYLASAVYAYAFLLPGPAAAPPIPLDPRNRMAADLYNIALARGLASTAEAAEAGEVDLAAGRYALPFGELEVDIAPAGFTWAGRRMDRFVSGVAWDVYGLRNRYRRPGIGAPLAASLAPLDPAALPANSRLPERLRVPVTAVLRLDGARQQILARRVRGRLELYAKDAAPTIRLGGFDVPLEYEASSALARSLEGVPVVATELLGFLGREAQRFRTARGQADLVTMTPYVPGKFPVVLVHGTASSPVRWVELFNEMDADHRIATRFQFWLFTYNTGNPIAYTGGLLREALSRAITEFDPGGTDAALRRMVVIGHSQGGLLAKLTAIDSGDRLWQNASRRVRLEDLDLTPETQAILRRSMLFEPLPFVERVIFMATPHRGSELATHRVVALLRRIISLPGDLLGVFGELAQAAASRDPQLARILREETPRSIDNMSPSHPFVRTIAAIPVDARVRAHSIIAVKGDGALAKESDGVVPYTSAHIDEAVSEKVVHSRHSVQGHPEAIEEVRRILLEHAGVR